MKIAVYLILLILNGCASDLGISYLFQDEFIKQDINYCSINYNTNIFRNKSEFWRPTGTKGLQFKTQQDYCMKNCHIPYCQTQEKLDYLRKLWVKQYMIDAYPEIYPEPKEKYLTPDEMTLVEKMYELE